MADRAKPTDLDKTGFCDELLSPSELFAARRRSHKIPVRGQKDFLPGGSEQQRERLQQALDEHWTLLAEERVEREGSLVKAVWVPAEKIVELQSPAGKFWQTMGFSHHGKQCLLAEEALYLMECGNLQVFYHDLPLSIQEGYERFLSPETVNLQQYQVFGHLKRLGYVVTRFDPRLVQTQYERQLNLPQSRDRPSKSVKRRRSHSPLSGTDLREGLSAEKMAAEDKGEAEVLTTDPDPALTTPHMPVPGSQGLAESSGQSPPADAARGRSWWTSREKKLQPPDPPQSPGPRWDFSSISFPDLGSRRAAHAHLAPPDPSLLPGALRVEACDAGVWLGRLNLRAERLSRRERERQRERERFQRDVNEDAEVRRCRDWTEYLQLLERRRCRHRGNRPAHLWEGRVTPLTQPGHCSSHGELLGKISVMKSSRLLADTPRLNSSLDWSICFNVYLPDTVAEFKKSEPGKPYTRICVCSFDCPVPDLRAIKQLSHQSGNVPVTCAVVDHGDISFYCFKDFQLPVDVYQ